MKRFLFSLCCLILAAGLAAAQEKDSPRKGQGYVFVAPGGVTEQGHTDGYLHFGIGGEGVIYKGLGLGAEIGYLFANGCPSCGLGLGSINGYYQFKSVGSSRKLVPFITGGFSAAVGSGGVGSGFNFGGGVNYWLRRRVGLRLEFRDHIPAEAPDAHLWQGRIGFAF